MIGLKQSVELACGHESNTRMEMPLTASGDVPYWCKVCEERRISKAAYERNWGSVA